MPTETSERFVVRDATGGGWEWAYNSENEARKDCAARNADPKGPSTDG